MEILKGIFFFFLEEDIPTTQTTSKAQRLAYFKSVRLTDEIMDELTPRNR